MSPPKPRGTWTHFSHGADIGIRGTGSLLAEAFTQAGYALIEIITNRRGVQPHQTFTVTCTADNVELLFYEWINTLIYEMTVRNLILSDMDIEIEGTHLTAICTGETIDRMTHRPVVEVKGATFTALRVTQDENGQWSAQCVVDV